MQPSQQMWRQRRVSLTGVVAEPVAGDFYDVELGVRVVGQAVATCLVVRAGAVNRGVVLGDVEVDRPRAQGRGELLQGSVKLGRVVPIKVLRQNRVFRGVVTQHIEQRVSHVGLEAERFGTID